MDANPNHFFCLPRSETQMYHQDGVHLNKKTHTPCYAIYVFIPLVDYDMTNGPTEFVWEALSGL